MRTVPFVANDNKVPLSIRVEQGVILAVVILLIAGIIVLNRLY